MSTFAHFSLKYSATSLRWQWCGFSSLHNANCAAGAACAWMDPELIAGVWSGCAIASLTGPALLPGRRPRRRSTSSVEMAAPGKPACCDLILEVMRFLVSAMPFLVPALISALVTLIVRFTCSHPHPSIQEGMFRSIHQAYGFRTSRRVTGVE
jgi:hypothetical protein